MPITSLTLLTRSPIFKGPNVNLCTTKKHIYLILRAAGKSSFFWRTF
ncbi:hypothetical protein GPLA_2073 [Paraglaciecola polaris LMG 21857]|uniref:Uncharacterized protein n=1 Tax=Paraglaciecola polaris LMG 21857 TaxID=1129793 RepID=K6ZW16_9ALTE|nr:hypothetical protein GPLA_2073 [Paraglaciecola polaris LMG 21857]